LCVHDKRAMLYNGLPDGLPCHKQESEASRVGGAGNNMVPLTQDKVLFPLPLAPTHRPGAVTYVGEAIPALVDLQPAD
jgi:hypothetical protein